MKVKLLNDGAYDDMGDVIFPVEVEAKMGSNGTYVLISKEELYRVGAQRGEFDVLDVYAFIVGEHVELPE